MIRSAVVALLIGMMTCVPAMAQDTPPGVPQRLPVPAEPILLTPDAAAALAVKRSTDLVIAEQGVLSAEGLLKQAEALSKLTLNLDAAYTVSGPSQTVTLPGSDETFEFTPTHIHREGLVATQPLYLGGRDRHSREAAGAGVRSAQENVQAALLSVVLAARQATLRVLRLQQVEVVDQKRVTALAEQVRITTAMFEAGTAPRFEVVQAETDLASVKAEAIRDATAVALAKAQLAAQLNLPQGRELTVEEGVPQALPEGDLYMLISAALQQRPEVVAQEAAVRAQEANVRLARAQNKPMVALQAGLANQTASIASSGLGWTLSVGLDWPLIQGGAVQGGIMVAEAALNTACLQMESLQQRIALQVTQAQLAWQDATQAMAVAEQGAINAQERARIAQVRFQSGVGLGVEVLDAQTALAAAETQVVNARYGLQLAVVALRAALGLTDLPEEPT